MKSRTIFTLILSILLVSFLTAGCNNNDELDQLDQFDPSVYERMGYTVAKRSSLRLPDIFDEWREHSDFQISDSLVHVPTDGSTIELSIKTLVNILFVTNTNLGSRSHTSYHTYYENPCPYCIGFDQEMNVSIPFPWVIFLPVEVTFNGMHITHTSWEKLRINLDPEQKGCTDTTWIAMGYGYTFFPNTEITNPRSRVVGQEFNLQFHLITLVRE